MLRTGTIDREALHESKNNKPKKYEELKVLYKMK